MLAYVRCGPENDPADPDASIDRILKFVDYGHASIGGLTGGLAIAVDNVSMWLAWKIFEIAQMADGQESSTRYITMAATNLPTPGELGIPADLASRWSEVMAKSFAAYNAEYARLDRELSTAKAQVTKNRFSKVEHDKRLFHQAAMG